MTMMTEFYVVMVYDHHTDPDPHLFRTEEVALAYAHDRDGHPLYLIGDVLDLVATDAARRAEEQAKRARRAAARTAESENAA